MIDNVMIPASVEVTESANWKKMSKIKITQVRSAIDRSVRQKNTIVALGIRKLHVPVVKEDTPQIQGMITKVKHLVTVEKV